MTHCCPPAAAFSFSLSAPLSCLSAFNKKSYLRPKNKRNKKKKPLWARTCREFPYLRLQRSNSHLYLHSKSLIPAVFSEGWVIFITPQYLYVWLKSGDLLDQSPAAKNSSVLSLGSIWGRCSKPRLTETHASNLIRFYCQKNNTLMNWKRKT